MPPGNSQPRSDFLYHSICNGFRIIMPSRSPARAWLSFLNHAQSSVKTVCSAWNNAFYRYVRWVRMAKARMILQKYHLSFMKWHSVAVFRTATIFVAFSASVWPDAGRVQRPFSGLTSKVNSVSSSVRMLCASCAANRTGGSFYSPVCAPAARRLSHVHPFVSTQRQHDHQFDFAHLDCQSTGFTSRAMLILE